MVQPGTAANAWLASPPLTLNVVDRSAVLIGVVRHHAPMDRVVTVIIIGSGFGGLCAARQLRRIGVDDFRILERRSFAGGTWIQNTYPGAAVDVQSPLYSVSGEPWDWSRLFAERHEIADYTNHLIAQYSLAEHTELETEVTGVTWDESAAQWEVSTTRGTWRSRFVINASGPLAHPQIPDFPGRDTFEGPAFHTNDWRQDVELRGKRVAVVGSGASAAQVIPAIADDTEHLHVFQRTPHWVLPRHDIVFSDWQRAVLRRRWAHDLLRWAIYWGLELRVVGFKYSAFLLNLVGRRPALSLIASQIDDADLRRKVTPDYALGCKRVILSNTLYPTLCRDDVTLHDKAEGISRVHPWGIETADGQRVELDAIVWATGFRATDGAIPYPIVGRGGESLERRWEEFPRAYLGTAVPGFPNFFLVTGPNTGIGHTSAIFIIECQMRYIADSIQAVREGNAASINVRHEAEEAYTRHIHEAMEGTVWKSGGCDSWYRSKSGHVVAMFPGFSFTFRRLTARFRPTDHELA